MTEKSKVLNKSFQLRSYAFQYVFLQNILQRRHSFGYLSHFCDIFDVLSDAWQVRTNLKMLQF